MFKIGQIVIPHGDQPALDLGELLREQFSPPISSARRRSPTNLQVTPGAASLVKGHMAQEHSKPDKLKPALQGGTSADSCVARAAFHPRQARDTHPGRCD